MNSPTVAVPYSTILEKQQKRMNHLWIFNMVYSKMVGALESVRAGVNYISFIFEIFYEIYCVKLSF